ncbi:MAG: oligosaccharide flippase family protein [Bacteroidetes bacterium]|nr:oligosaccharide flippase family protein [Bacteroidota bacterium]
MKQILRNDFLKNAGVLFSSTGIAQIISFLIIPVLSRVYSKSEHGVAVLFTSIVAVLVTLSGLQYNQAIIVESDRNRAKDLVMLSMILNFLWSLLFFLIVLIGGSSICSIFGMEDSGNWMFWIPITVFITGAADTILVWFNRERRYKKVASNRVIGMAGGSAYKVLHPFQAVVPGNGLVIGHVVGQFLQLILLLPKKLKPVLQLNPTRLKEIAVRYKAFPLLATPSTLINVFGSYLPVFLIGAFLGEEINGLYGNAVKLTFIPLSAISYAVGQVYFERLARLRDDVAGRLSLSLNLLRFLFWLSVIPVSVLMIWGDVLIPFILGSSWEPSGSMVQILVLLYFVIYLSSPFAAAYEVFNSLKRQLWFTALFTVLSGFVLFLLLKQTGDVLIALTGYAFIASLVRIAMLFDCFRLTGKNIFISVVKALMILGGLTLLNLVIKFLLI